MHDENLEKKLREELGPIYDACDTVIYLENEKDRLFRLSQELIDNYWELIEKKIEKSDDKHFESKVISTFLLALLTRVIKTAIIKEDWHIVQNNLNEHFKKCFNDGSD